MLGSPLPRKMLVTIGTLKNVDYLDRISNRMSFPLPSVSFRIVSFPTPFPFSPPFRLEFRPHVADVENEFSYQNAIW